MLQFIRNSNMRLKIQHIRYAIILLFLLYGLNNTYFERNFYFNEILSLFGFGVFVFASLKKNLKLVFPKSYLIRLLLAYWAIFLIYAIVSLPLKTEWYFYFRHFSIFYSSFIFFLGFYWLEDFRRLMQKLRKLLIGFYLLFIPTDHPHYFGRVLDRYSVSAFFPFAFRKISYWILFVVNILYAYFFDSLTGIILSIIILVVLILPTYAHFRLLFIAALISFSALFMYLSPYFAKYKENAQGNHLFGNLHYVYQHSKILQIDHNTSWRMVYWYRLLVEDFPENIFGKGIGTPYLPYIEGKDTAESNYDDKHDAHTTGSHNTYVSMFARFGVSILLFFFLLYTYILKDFYRNKIYYTQKGDVLFFVAFFTVSVIGLFNPFLETPTYSGLYWFFLGAVAKSIFNRQFANENPANS